MPHELEVFESNAEFAVGRCGAIYVYTWRKSPSLQNAVPFARHLKHAAELAGPAGFVMLGVVEASAGPPDSATRDHIGRVLEREYAGLLRANALIFDGPGVRGAMVRAVVTALSLISFTPYPSQVFGKPADATAFVAEMARKKGLGEYDAAQLAESLAALRKAPVAEAKKVG